MLIIFDLDDTLIETSRCLTPYVLKRAFKTMQAAGLQVEDRAFEELLAINASSLTSDDAIAAFVGLYPDQEVFCQIGVESLSLPVDENIVLEPVPHALAVLERLGRSHDLALVTRGVEARQLKKMEKAGIEPERFSKLVVSLGPTKKGDYRALLDFFGCPPDEGVVCGDRVPFDLTPAKELGMGTVHFRNGRGVYQTDPAEDVDATIHSLTELEGVLAKHEV